MLGNLFRDQLDRYGEMEALADEWARTVAARAGATEFALNADDPLIADLGRDEAERPRQGVTYFGIDDHAQALPELQHAFDAKHCRRCGHPYAYEVAFVGHLGHYSCPNCGAQRPRPDVAATEIELLGMEGSRSTVRTPAGEIELRLPLPGLYNVYNALAALTAALRARRGAGADRGRAGRDARRLRPGRDDRGRRGRRLDPADQEPGRRQRGPAHAAAWRPRTGRSTSGSRSTTGSPTAATSPGSGTPTSSCSPTRVRRVVCAGTRAPEMALRLKYAGWPVERIAVEPAIEASLDGAVAPFPSLGPMDRQGRTRGRGSSPCPPTRRCWSCASCSPTAAWRRSSGDERRADAETIWHDVECGAYAADLPLWEELAAAAEGEVLDLGCGTGRVALHLARRGHRVVGARPRARTSSRRCASAPPGCRCETLARRRRASSTSAARCRWRWRRCRPLQLLDDAADRAACLRRVADHLEPGGRFAAAILEEMPEPDGSPPPLPDVREVDGWVYSSLAVEAAVGPGEIVVHRLRQTVSPAGELREEPNRVRITTFPAAQLEAEGAAAGLVPVAAAPDRGHRHPRRRHRRRPRQGWLRWSCASSASTPSR